MAWTQPVGRSLEEITKNRENLNKNISKLRREILKIKFSKNFKLNEEDKKNYDSWNKEARENPKMFKHYRNEQDYAIIKREGNICSYKDALTALICEEKGHVESVTHMDCYGTYVECKRCGESYKRSMSIEESKSWVEMENTHTTI